jgi:hypothetical protein
MSSKIEPGSYQYLARFFTQLYVSAGLSGKAWHEAHENDAFLNEVSEQMGKEARARVVADIVDLLWVHGEDSGDIKAWVAAQAGILMQEILVEDWDVRGGLEYVLRWLLCLNVMEERGYGLLP